VDHVRFEFAWQLLDDQSIMRAFVHANSTTYAKAFRNVRFACFVIKNDAFLSVPNWRAKGVAFVVAFLWLTTVFL
jgi:hypothetical protein